MIAFILPVVLFVVLILLFITELPCPMFSGLTDTRFYSVVAIFRSADLFTDLSAELSLTLVDPMLFK